MEKIKQESERLLELFKKQLMLLPNTRWRGELELAAKQCALICIDEILNEFPQGYKGNFEERRKEYWQQVKQYIIDNY